MRNGLLSVPGVGISQSCRSERLVFSSVRTSKARSFILHRSVVYWNALIQNVPSLSISNYDSIITSVDISLFIKGDA